MQIKPAQYRHLSGIGNVLSAVWDEHVVREVGIGQIDHTDCALLVGEQEGMVCGFVSAFIVEFDKQPIWWIDSLAVHPNYQGRGLGRVLVEATFKTAQRLDLQYSRSLVKEDNIPSQRTFSGAGYHCGAQHYEMLFWSPEKAAAGHVQIAPPQTIDTITYRGVWIGDLEPLDQQQQLSAVVQARDCCAQQKRDSASTLLKRNAQLHAALRSTAQSNGFYQWWQRAL